MLTVNIQGFGKDTPTSRSYHVIRRGHAHISLSLSTLQNHSADAIKSGLKPVQAMCIQSRCDPIAVRTDLKRKYRRELYFVRTQQKHFGELNIGELHKLIFYTRMQIIISGLNMGDFIQKPPIAEVYPSPISFFTTLT